MNDVVKQFDAFQPPAALNSKARSMWRSCLTSRRRELWDAPALSLLGMLCRVWSQWDAVQTKLEDMDASDPDYAKLVRLADLLAGRTATLSTKLRLTPQAIDKKRAAVGRGTPHRINFGAHS